jgi:hypothetical protein
MKVDAETARRLFHLDEASGRLYWKMRPASDFIGALSPEQVARLWNAKNAGKVAGSVDEKGYLRVAIWHRNYRQHRIIWLMVHGEWPPDQIDHHDRDRKNNRPSNLKAVTNAENCKNCGISPRNKSGHVGVNFRNGKWRAQITASGKQKHLGNFDQKSHAIAARKAAAAALGFNPNHGSAE